MLAIVINEGVALHAEFVQYIGALVLMLSVTLVQNWITS